MTPEDNMTPEEAVKKFKAGELSPEEALQIIGREMERLRREGRSTAHLNSLVSTVIGIAEEPENLLAQKRKFKIPKNNKRYVRRRENA